VNGWTPTVFLDPASLEPVYLQIAHALMHEIHRGRLKPGDGLPGYRTLAAQLGVNRNTVMAAFRELQAEGWVVSTPGEGSLVAEEPPARLPGEDAQVVPMGFDLGAVDPAVAQDERTDMLKVASGIPDPRLLPGAALARAYRRALTLDRQSALRLEDPQGHPKLREALARMLAGTRGIPAAPDRILITRGSQMATFLVAEALCRPGDAVAVEALGDRRIWEVIAKTGARCLPIPTDADGLSLPALEALLKEGPLRAVVVTPQRQYPTLAVLSPKRRARLLELAAHHRFAILEMDQDSEFQFEGRATAPLAAEDPAGVVIHVGTLSKVFSPSLRLGFVHGPLPLITRMRDLRLAFDRQGDLVLERAMAELMEDGEIARHLNRMHRVYRLRRDVLCAALRREFGDRVTVEPPSGGLALWVNVRGDIDVDAWAARALAHGVAFQPGRQFAFDSGPVQGFRIGFSNYPEPELEEVARRMASAMKDLA
jgi:GntR family transcriptional regulator/MocR family aminotransferase